MIIGLGKFGKSTRFGNRGISKKSMVSGAVDAPTIYRQLLKYNPEHTFVMLGLSDYSRLDSIEKRKVNPHGNLIDLWEDLPIFKKKYRGQNRPEKELHINYMIDHVMPMMEKTNLKCDTAVMLPGHMLPLGVEGKSINHRGDALAKCLAASYVYAGPLYHFFNCNPMPYLMLVTDPRVYPGLNEDLFVAPKLVLSQFTETYTVKHRTQYDSIELVEEKVQARYSSIESLYLIEEDKEVNPLFDDVVTKKEVNIKERDIPMMLFLNEGDPSRYDDVMKYVLGDSNQIPIYGKWKHKGTVDDQRFQEVPMATLAHLFDRIKYTFCIPIKEGWATGKFWDMARMGIIPFVHPSYDTQKNIGFPEFLRIRDAKDLATKMQYLDDNPEEYVKLRNQLQSMITEDKVDGSYINNTIMDALREITT